MFNSVLPQEASQQEVTSQTKVVQEDSAGGFKPSYDNWAFDLAWFGQVRATVLSRKGNPT
ncbi:MULTISPECIES: hypothetical protein [Nostoc]|uniref:Uncharacterized protein n=1 Tax=Nostoc flagelliforme FACHB-838 TaxID=2692904 RepID=A0ABR8E9K3_9NOSO|nr:MULTISPECIES: hypothetical protein [Nostoc]MBD2249333.1 hypothetical protein [Nostoc sp. FACHB-888]MBD2537209.1 hypothetical protein [Nostoc flagelliforme FACHB-838]